MVFQVVTVNIVIFQGNLIDVVHCFKCLMSTQQLLMRILSKIVILINTYFGIDQTDRAPENFLRPRDKTVK